MLAAQMLDLAQRRGKAIDTLETRGRIECELAEIIERLEARQRSGVGQSEPAEQARRGPTGRMGLWARMMAWLRGGRRRGGNAGEAVMSEPPFELAGAGNLQLRRRMRELRSQRDALPDLGDPISLAIQIETLAKTQLPALLRERVRVDERERQELARAKDDHEFEGGRASVPGELARSVLCHRPVWLASVLGTPRRIPLDDGLFDLVIFDEASQCDIASAIPLLARAKRAVIVGDDQQLAFIPQLGLAQDRNLMQAQGLPIRGMSRFAQSRRSLFDFGLRVPGVPRVTLRHQYRSAGQIVDYISRNFYGGELIVAQPADGALLPKGCKPGLAWTDVRAPATPEAGNTNRAEGEAIASEILRLLETDGYGGSIGVIAPFRAQVLCIEEEVRARIPEALLEKAGFRAATVDGFQGQERDLILFSPCLGPASPTSGIAFVQKDPRRLNVAISRARGIAHVFGDLAFARSGKIRALATLAADATEPRRRSGEGVFDSEWERRVYHALRERGLDPKPQHEVAGRRLDFALFGPHGVKLDLEVDGRRWHQNADGRRKSADIWRDAQMKALGWRVCRFWVDELSLDMEACLDRVEQQLS
jgi:very-short-patch-repair endonuclease